jgi:N-acetylneuraminate lyase
MRSDLTGVMPALMTAYDDAGAVDLAAIRRLAARHLEEGAHGFFLCGSTGEGPLLTPEERMGIVEAVIGETAGAAAVIVHVGALATDAAQALARHARKAGADAVGVLPPVYYKVGFDGLVRHVKAVAEAAELPTFYYHIPSLTHVDLTVEQLQELRETVQNLAGFKFTHGDLYGMWRLAESNSGIVLSGVDQMLYQSFTAGASGGIGSTYNYQMPAVRSLYDALQRGDHVAALEIQQQMNRVIEVLFKYGASTAAEKAFMRCLGIELGPPRGPMIPFPDERLPEMRSDLEQIGFPVA